MAARSEALHFNRFRLEPDRRRLFADNAPVALTARAYDLLEFLVKNRDRIVTRDEIVAHIWRGMVVGENNLSVQMSLLRRALAEHAGSEALIVNLPGRGYRFVGDVAVAQPVPPPVPPVALLGLPDPAQQKTSTPPPVSRNTRWIRWLAGAACFLMLAGVVEFATWRHAWISSWSGSMPKSPDARLSIAVTEFASIGQDPRSPLLAADYTQSVLARFGQFDDIVLYPDHEPVRPKIPPHFRLSGSVQASGNDAVVMTTLTNAATGQLLHRNNATLPADASILQQSAAAMGILLDLRPSLFQAEFGFRHGPARDALDLVIEAHVAAGGGRHSLRALALAEQAMESDPASIPARVLLSTLLMERMLKLPATSGDEPGRRALQLIDSVLLEQPGNFLFIEHRASALEALGRLDEAQATAELGLRIEPNCDNLIQTLAQVLLQKGDLAKAGAMIRPSTTDVGDDRMARLAFAEARYADAVALTRRIVAAGPGDWNMPFTILLEVASLSRLGRTAEARALLAQCMQAMPEEFKRVSAQRQAFYVLPEPAWGYFKQGLADAGMSP